MSSNNLNPMYRLRHALTPTDAQRGKRHWRDRDKNYLLQRELAELIPCSVSCIRECERESRFPLQRAVQQNATALYYKVFPKNPKAT